MHERLCFKFTLFLSDRYSDVPGDPFFRKPFSLGFSVLTREKFHSPVLYKEHFAVIEAFNNVCTGIILINKSELVWLPELNCSSCFLKSVKSILLIILALEAGFLNCLWVSDRTALRSSQRLHIRSWSWVQVPLKAGSLLSLSAYWLQWSDTREELETWTYCRSKIVSEQDYARPDYSGEYT